MYEWQIAWRAFRAAADIYEVLPSPRRQEIMFYWAAQTCAAWAEEPWSRSAHERHVRGLMRRLLVALGGAS